MHAYTTPTLWAALRTEAHREVLLTAVPLLRDGVLGAAMPVGLFRSRACGSVGQRSKLQPLLCCHGGSCRVQAALSSRGLGIV